MLHPTKVTLRSYMPVDTQVRILARRAPWAWNEWAKVSKQSGMVTGSDWGNTTGRRNKDTLLDGVVFRSQGASISTGGTAAQACGLQAPWKQLWAGTAGSAGAGGGTGIVSPAFLPPDFPTETLLIEVILSGKYFVSCLVVPIGLETVKKGNLWISEIFDGRFAVYSTKALL